MDEAGTAEVAAGKAAGERVKAEDLMPPPPIGEHDPTVLGALGRLEEAMDAVGRGLSLNAESAVLQSEMERLKKAAADRSKVPTGETVALTGLALAKECNRLGRPAQAVRELDKLITNKVADAELYCERSLAHNNNHQLALAVEDASTAVYLYLHQHDPELKPWENPKDLGIKVTRAPSAWTSPEPCCILHRACALRTSRHGSALVCPILCVLDASI